MSTHKNPRRDEKCRAELVRAATVLQDAPCPGKEAIWPQIIESVRMRLALADDELPAAATSMEGPRLSVDLYEGLVDAMEARDQLGRAKYGTPLQTHNGRDFLVDLFQEALDAFVYAHGYDLEKPDDPLRQELVGCAADLLAVTARVLAERVSSEVP